MPARKVCSLPGCPTIVHDGRSRCPQHRAQADRARGTRQQRGYDQAHETGFRAAVLASEPRCRLCGSAATVADHWPLSRRDLTARGLDPNDPRRGRALCATCHSRETARLQPGGWNA